MARPPTPQTAQAGRRGPGAVAAAPRRRPQPPRRSARSVAPPSQPLRAPAAAAAAGDGVVDPEAAAAQRGAGPGSEPAAALQALVADAQAAVAAQQAAGLGPAYPLERTRQLVETAMLAAVTGLAYTVGSLLKLEGYMAYVLPLPVVLSALRSGPLPAVKTLTTACLLLLILMGPVRAATYLLVYGVLSLTLGACWALRLPWAVSIPLGAVARIAGYFAYISLSSWVTNENLLQLLLSNVYALLDQLSAVLGTTGTPPLLAVVVVLCSLLFVNSLMYVALTHVLYAVLLRGMGLHLHGAPASVQRFVEGLPE